MFFHILHMKAKPSILFFALSYRCLRFKSHSFKKYCVSDSESFNFWDVCPLIFAFRCMFFYHGHLDKAFNDFPSRKIPACRIYSICWKLNCKAYNFLLTHYYLVKEMKLDLKDHHHLGLIYWLVEYFDQPIYSSFEYCSKPICDYFHIFSCIHDHNTVLICKSILICLDLSILRTKLIIPFFIQIFILKENYL